MCSIYFIVQIAIVKHPNKRAMAKLEHRSIYNSRVRDFREGGGGYFETLLRVPFFPIYGGVYLCLFSRRLFRFEN